MGHGMAKNLIAKGQKLSITVHKQRDRVKDLLDAGATLADNAAALGASCDIVLICVTGSPQVEAVVAGPDGLLSKPKAGLIIVDCSTSEPHSTTHLRELALSKGVVFVDAPLARSPVEAEAGRLNIMVGSRWASPVLGTRSSCSTISSDKRLWRPLPKPLRWASALASTSSNSCH